MAAHAAFSRSSLYAHFSGKDESLAALANWTPDAAIT
jgi:AcrR family transcriptional regulator